MARDIRARDRGSTRGRFGTVRYRCGHRGTRPSVRPVSSRSEWRLSKTLWRLKMFENAGQRAGGRSTGGCLALHMKGMAGLPTSILPPSVSHPRCRGSAPTRRRRCYVDPTIDSKSAAPRINRRGSVRGVLLSAKYWLLPVPSPTLTSSTHWHSRMWQRTIAISEDFLVRLASKGTEDVASDEVGRSTTFSYVPYRTLHFSNQKKFPKTFQKKVQQGSELNLSSFPPVKQRGNDSLTRGLHGLLQVGSIQPTRLPILHWKYIF